MEYPTAGGPATALVEARRPSKRRVSEGVAGYLFLLPWFTGLALIVAGPMAASLYLSFTSWNPLGSPEWVGFDNYVRMFTADARYIASVKVTLTYVVVSVPLQLTFALALAMALDRGVRGMRFYRSVFYLPSLLGGSVAIALLWRQVFGANGLVNQFLGLIGVDDAPNWIGSPGTAVYTLVALAVWQFGAPMVIFLAGLRQIPAMYYEAAAVDGAGRIRQFFRITLPLLSPVIFFNLILQVINAFQAFTPAYVISDGLGGPVDSTLFYTLYLYQEGFTSFRMGYASAMAWVLLAVVAIFTAINFLSSRFWVFYADE
ncbi:carbohydrate ABC transporter permease [Georgenia deserti]|uniref:Carbohydrate ABC transporter permease n=1 Tax=Georgenia deserti TaxID=2093781 RepID=A0ABW4L267_9MICO